MSFLTKTDFEGKLGGRVIELLTGSDDTVLTKASDNATGLLRDRLADKYAIAGELSKTSTDRNSMLVRYALAIAVYDLYSVAPDEEIPERVIKDYNDAIDDLKLISQGKLSCTLTLKTGSD